jgi:hypothetical protein
MRGGLSAAFENRTEITDDLRDELQRSTEDASIHIHRRNMRFCTGLDNNSVFTDHLRNISESA